jgi:hypothetical protein
VKDADAWATTVEQLANTPAPRRPAPEAPPRGPTKAAVWKLQVLRTLMPPGFPPCFGSRAAWVEYLETATLETRQRHADGPLRFDDFGTRLNEDFDFCADCTENHRQQRLREGLCVPMNFADME